MKRCAFALMATLLLTSSAMAQRADPIRVYVFMKDATPSPSTEFVDDSARRAAYPLEVFTELMNRLRKKKSLAIVDNRASADVEIEMLSLHSSQTETKLTTRDPWGNLRTGPEYMFFGVDAKLTVGDYSTDISAVGTSGLFGDTFKAAARKAADKADEWISMNRAQLLKRRAEKPVA